MAGKIGGRKFGPNKWQEEFMTRKNGGKNRQKETYIKLLKLRYKRFRNFEIKRH